MIKEYISKKYGAEHVCSVGLWQSYNLRLAMQDAARALGKDKSPVYTITKALPEDFDERPQEDVVNAITAPPDEVKLKNPELAELSNYYKTEDGKLVVDAAMKMVGLLKTQGKHAAGIIISNTNLFDTIPMSRLGGLWTSQWTEGYSPQLSKFGLVKWDVLGLKTMSYIWKCVQLVKASGKDLLLPVCKVCSGTGLGKNPDPYGDKCLECAGLGATLEGVDFADAKALKLANDLQTESVFQFETDLAKSILKKGGVKSFNDLLIYTTLGRPGPLPLIDEYIKRRDDESEEWRKEEHELVVGLFQDTFALVCFQEQLSAFWTEICGFTVPEAEAARKAVAKKWGEQLEKVMKKAEVGATKKIGREEAIKWNKRIETFGRYAFNRAHATSYSIIAYLCLYLKSKYPAEWWAAVLSVCDRDKIPNYVMVSKNEGVRYSALHCDELTRDFTVKDDVIRPGLLGIKGLGEKGVANALASVGTKYESMEAFVEKNGKGKILMERLIKLGAFDHLLPNRPALWIWYLLKYSTCEAAKEAKKFMREKLGIVDEKQKLNVSFEDVVRVAPKWGLRKILAFEKAFYGYHFTSPMSCYKLSKERYVIADAAEVGIMEVVVQDNEVKQTKSGKKYFRLLVTDGKANARLTVWDAEMFDDGDDLSPGAGIRVEVLWDEKFNSYSVKRGTKIIPLDRRE